MNEETSVIIGANNTQITLESLERTLKPEPTRFRLHYSQGLMLYPNIDFEDIKWGKEFAEQSRQLIQLPDSRIQDPVKSKYLFAGLMMIFPTRNSILIPHCDYRQLDPSYPNDWAIVGPTATTLFKMVIGVQSIVFENGLFNINRPTS
jgi:hypothetical protein